jgi:hypothetical protein
MKGDILILHQPFTKLGPNLNDPDFIEQDGVIFAWSESNTRYERAWWLDKSAPDCSLTRHLRETRQPPANVLPSQDPGEKS